MLIFVHDNAKVKRCVFPWPCSKQLKLLKRALCSKVTSERMKTILDYIFTYIAYRFTGETC